MTAHELLQKMFWHRAEPLPIAVCGRCGSADTPARLAGDEVSGELPVEGWLAMYFS